LGDSALERVYIDHLSRVALLPRGLQSWLIRHDRASMTVESGGEKFTITGSVSHEQQQTR
jgi:hypothetical protein